MATRSKREAGTNSIRSPSPSATTGARTRLVGMDAATIIRIADYHRARQGFPSDSALADVFPVNRSSVSRWKQGEPIDANHARLLRDLATVVAHLAEYYEPETIPKWLHGMNPDLGDRRPIDVLRAGELPDVLSVIEAQTSGAFF